MAKFESLETLALEAVLNRDMPKLISDTKNHTSLSRQMKLAK